MPPFVQCCTNAWYFQDSLPLVGTNSDKIGTTRAIIIERKAIGIPSGIGFGIKATIIHYDFSFAVCDPNFRRGEGGWVDVGWAFMVTRGSECGVFIDEQTSSMNHVGRP